MSPVKYEMYETVTILLILRVFPKLYKVGNNVNKGIRKEEQNKFSKRKVASIGIEPRTSCYLLWCLAN